MLIQGENDSAAPIAESEQYYMALKQVGVETVMVRYPREDHGLLETQHVIDRIDRSMDGMKSIFRPRMRPFTPTCSHSSKSNRIINLRRLKT